MLIAQLLLVPAIQDLAEQIKQHGGVLCFKAFDLFRVVVGHIHMDHDHLVPCRRSAVIKPCGHVSEEIILHPIFAALGLQQRIGRVAKGKGAEITTAVEHMHIALLQFQNVEQVEGKHLFFEKHNNPP